jgi:glycosyltransferase involved in cell wall biosynthesis
VFLADMLQRYAPEGFDDGFFRHEADVMIPFLRQAQTVLVTTPAAYYDAQSYIGMPRERIVQFPFFIEPKTKGARCHATPAGDYFVWSANYSPHKNQLRVLEALRDYYARGGRLETFLIGLGTHLFRADVPQPLPVISLSVNAHVEQVRQWLGAAQGAIRMTIGGEIPDAEYADVIARAKFVLNASLYDNGCLTTIDAAQFGRPSLCSAHPAQQYVDRLLGLNSLWFDPYDPRDLANKLLQMEEQSDSIPLPSAAALQASHADRLAGAAYRALSPLLKGRRHACCIAA